ncbi:DUF11 domain-containing protein [Neolewinella persica]|uniref:DUF11 domain-containing protein n=1 Tax=Neolewinella persica TaxID=70998 RepID=UPI00146CEFA5|nr:DUF11 domain-containing protein [Neolewinella persica]
MKLSFKFNPSKPNRVSVARRGLIMLLLATFCILFASYTAYGQAPGGVSANLKLWLKGDAGVTVAGGGISEWADQGPGAYTTTQGFSDRRPQYTASSALFNCNPSVDFDLGLDAMNTDVLMYNRPYTFFAVYNSTSTSTAGRRAIQGDNNWLIGPHGNTVGFFADGWVENAQIPSNIIPTISTATSNDDVANNAFFYYNGENRTPAGVTAPGVPGRVYLGRAPRAESFGGSFGEIIAFTREVTPTERNKVESYLAVKYGISLDQTIFTNYVRSDGTIIWDNTFNGDFNQNIFGVGKDSGSGLQQLGSQSVNSSLIRLDNPSALGEGDFLFLSDNGLSSGAQVQPGLPGGAVAASTLVWNVSKTGTVGTVGITIEAPAANTVLLLDNNNDGIFETALSPTSSMGNTNTYEGLSLDNFAKLKIGYLESCFPGGITADMALWLKAKDVLSEGGKVHTWPDFSGNNVDYRQAFAANQPELIDEAINNNPVVNFTGDVMTNPLGITGDNTLNDINIYTVTRVNNSLGTANFFRSPASGGCCNELAIYMPFSNTLFWRPGGPDVTTPFGNIPDNTLPRLYSFHASTTSGQTYPGVKNVLASNNRVFASSGTFNGLNGRAGTSNLGNNIPNSDIAEFIAYPGPIDAAQHNKIQTYLAVKYGISLDQTVATNYTSSNGTVVWDAAANSVYSNNIFGIGLDKVGCLDQQTSVSVNTDRISISNPSSLVNNNYLLLSDNDLSTTPVAEAGLPGGATLATPLAWNVSKTGLVGTVDLRIVSEVQGAILLIDNNNDGIFETAIPATSQISEGDGFVNTFPAVSLNNSAKMKLGYECAPALNNVVTMEYLVTPTVTTCSGTGTFTVRVKNLSPATIDNMIFRDSLPPGISYVPSSVSGTGVTFGGNIMDDRVVTFNIANIPSSGSVDVSFDVAAACDVSTEAASITNSYQVFWDCSFSAVSTTPSYPILFPSLSITLENANASVGCYSPFVRTVTICNGGFGSVDSVTVTDTQNNPSIVVQSFDLGTVSGAGTTRGQTVLKAADFMTVGNGDGKFDQNECIVVNDTLLVVGSATPVSGNIRADWGCNGETCMNGTTNNTVLVNTAIVSGGGTMGDIPNLTRTLSIISDIKSDSSGQLYNRPITYQYIIKNNSTAPAIDVHVHPVVTGLNYIDRDSIWVYRDGDERYHPNWSVFASNFFFTNVASNTAGVLEPYPFDNFDQPSNTLIDLEEIAPGDSVVVTFVVGTAGPVTKYNSFTQNFCGGGSRVFCNTCYAYRFGPAVGGVVDARTYWRGLGCPGGLYQICRANFPSTIYNGRDPEPIPSYTAGFGALHPLARFSGFSLIDSTDLDRERCAYGEDTLRLLFRAGELDLPFFTERSQFYIKIKTNGGIAWDGDLDATFGRLSSWSNEAWQADRVEDMTAIDSTILVYFKRSDLPPTALSTFEASYDNSYRGGDFELAIHVVNLCPGPAVRRVYMTRFFDIDSTNTEPGIESGAFDFQAGMEWNSICPGPCADGLQILEFDQMRSTFGAPDNNSDGVADASGSLNFDIVEDRRITWTDTLQVNYRMVVRTTKPGGVPYLYMKSTIDYVSLPAAIICNEFLEKDFPRVTLTRPGVGVFDAVGNSRGVNTDNTYLVDLSLQGGDGLTIPGITSYQDGDTIDFVQNLTYATPHYGWNVIEWNLLHVPYTSLVQAPEPPEQFKCDSVICRFETVDMTRDQTSSLVSGGPSCGTTNVVRIGSRAQVNASGCNNSPFPGEVRNILAPVYMKFVNPASSRWTITAVRAYLSTNIESCIAPVNNVLPPELYFYSGDTLMLDLRAIHAFYGYDTEESNLYSISQFDLSMTYTPPPNLVGCVKDHADIATGFAFFTDYEVTEGLRLDSTTLVGVGGGVTANLNWPGGNNNSFTQYAGSSISVNSPKVIWPVQYNKGSSGVYGNDFIAIPPSDDVVIDSIVDQVTGATVFTEPGSNIWQVGYIPNGGNRRFNIHTTLTTCNANRLDIYADRTPCSGYPESWEAYTCKANARRATFNYVTFEGELQMVDSLFTPLKDLCVEDTIQFRVINSQTQDANSVKVSFKMPQNSFIEPGHTRLRLGTGAWVSVADPILEAGVYSWTLPLSDTLRNVSLNPENIMLLQVGYNTGCGYTSGSQIQSMIAGKVGCGDITSLFNTNPPPLSIIGAPTLSYFTNPTITIEQIDDCTPGAGYDYSVYLLVSGDETGATDSVRVTLPENYGFQSYNAAAAGANNAPPVQPIVLNLPDGTKQLSWQVPPGVMPGDSIKFTFQYEESVGSNKCAPIPEQVSRLSTIISTGVYCVTINAICPVGIENGVDTVQLQSFKPNITPTAVATFTQGCDNVGSESNLDITGLLTNSGSAELLAGTDVIMEVFLDMDASGTVTAGDISFDPLVYDQGLMVDSSYTYTYADAIPIENCVDCAGKNVLVRISKDPDSPVGASQCLCDSLTVISVIPELIVTEKPNAGDDQTADCAVLPGGVSTLLAFGEGSWTAQAGNPGTATIANDSSSQTNVTMFSAVGDYFFIWSDGSCQDTAKITVTAKPEAGPDQVVSCVPSFPGGSATMAASGTGTWTAEAGNPGTAIITNDASPGTTITDFEVAGTYQFIFTDGMCTDTAQVVVSDKVDAGPDLALECITLPGGSVAAEATGTGLWTAQTGNPGAATITSTSSPTTTITDFTAVGTYNFIWAQGVCTDTMSVIVTEKPEAGPDQMADCVALPGGTVTMAATGTGTWTPSARNPGTATITTPNSPTTTITTFQYFGTYDFVYSNGACSDTASVAVTLKPNAGPDQIACVTTLPTSTTTMQGVGLGTWTADPANPGTATIDFPTSQTTSITGFSAYGTYTFYLTYEGCADTAMVEVQDKPDAGPDQTTECLESFPGGTATMAAAAGIGTWVEEPGNPGTSTIVSTTSNTTVINTFSAPGTYKYVWSDGPCTDTAFVFVFAKPDAGADQMVDCAALPGGTATMTATGTGTWSPAAGNPGTAVIATVNSPTTDITTFSAAGTYEFVWTNEDMCTDTASIVVTAQPNAGANQLADCVVFPGGSVTMAAVGTGMWTEQAGNPGSSVITTPNSNTTTITTFSAAGVYNYIWTNAAGCADTTFVTVTAKPSSGPDQMLSCIPTQPGGSVTMAATGMGAWRAQAGNPGMAVITFNRVPTTTITAFTLPGTYNFIWTDEVTGCTDTVAITTTFVPDAGPNQVVCRGSSTALTASIDLSGTWTADGANPPGARLGATTDGVSMVDFELTASGVFNFIYTVAGCTPDVMSVTIKDLPTATFTTTPSTCADSESNDDGMITLATQTEATHFGVSTLDAVSYDGPMSIGGVMPITGLPVVKENIPITGGTYIVRVFNGSDDCFTDVPVTLASSSCCETPTANAITVRGTCTNALVPNDDARIVLMGSTNADAYGISEGTSYSGPAYPGTALGTAPFDLKSDVPNAGATYTVRIFNNSNTCFWDTTIVVPATPCIYDPIGYFYCEETGKIIPGGSFSASGPGVILIIEDGSTGRYQFETDGTPGVYTMSFTAPPGYAFSTTHLASAGPLDPTGQPDPFEVGSGTTDGAFMDDFSPGANLFYLSFIYEAGDPEIVLNNIPLSGCCTAPPELTVNDSTTCAGTVLDLSSLVTTDSPPENVSYYRTQADAIAGTNPLVNNYVAPGDTTTYYVRSASASDCFSTEPVAVNVLPSPVPVIAGTAGANATCSGVAVNLADLVLNADGGVLTFYAKRADAEAATAPISATVSPTTATNYYVRSTVTSGSVSCYGVAEITVVIAAADCVAPTVTRN